jgi:hypothetical protein
MAAPAALPRRPLVSPRLLPFSPVLQAPNRRRPNRPRLFPFPYPPPTEPLAINGGRRCARRPPPHRTPSAPSQPYIRSTELPLQTAPLPSSPPSPHRATTGAPAAAGAPPPDLLLRRGSLLSGPGVSFPLLPSSSWCFPRAIWCPEANIGSSPASRRRRRRLAPPRAVCRRRPSPARHHSRPI